ncbi:nuclear transport factor 2 family protein [Guptibacillus spartinae]|uniref:nuclear transport factor 2 family protein n=1 Tax=Guptibacillus spartinae TaxID=3025679 RepID=UPI00235EC242|nr:nuclear transport factor 2 family protein [Pseudalkalibacillus spartinae]
MNYTELRTKLFGEVFSEIDYSSLREFLIQSYLFLDESNKLEARRLLVNIFGLSDEELNERSTAFIHHNSNKATLLNTLKTAENWVENSNKKDIPGLLDFSHSDIEIMGPKGSISGSHHLTDWIERANLRLDTIRRFAKGHHIVLEQQGTWYDENGQEKGHNIVFTFMRVIDGKVVFLARYDNKVEAFQVSELDEGNLIE